jgi:hypothetical protein
VSIAPRAFASRTRSVAVLAMASLLVTACAGSDDTIDVVPAASQDTTQETPADGDADIESVLAELPMVVYDVYLSRDPFDPVREPPVEAAAAEDDDSAADEEPGVPAGATTPVFSDAPASAAPDSGGPACKTSGDVVCDGTSIALTEITTSSDGRPVAIVQVDTTVLAVAEGAEFAGRFRLLAVTGDCATFLYGDESFTLCEGAQTMK